MKKKLLALLGCSLLLFTVLAGCGVNDQDPPPENNVNIDDPMNNGDVNNGNGAGNGTGTNNGTGTGGGENNGTNGENDINTNNDGDVMRDNNDQGEDMVEDRLDRNDDDNKDK